MGILGNGTLANMLITFFISMIPVLELRGAIPFGVASGLNIWVAVIISVIGNILPVPFIIIFVRKVFSWMRSISKKLDSIVAYFEKKADKHSRLVSKYEFWGLFILVAIPIPGTGAWTGALVAAMLEMRLKDAFLAIVFGVIAAGMLVSFLTYGLATIT